MKLNYKLWLEEGEKVFGDGPWDLLTRVERTGSLRQAAAEINMSYSQAWHLIRGLEEKLDFKLLKSRSGGSSGGGSTLTDRGHILVNTFGSFRREAEGALKRLEEKYFDERFCKEIQRNAEKG